MGANPSTEAGSNQRRSQARLLQQQEERIRALEVRLRQQGDMDKDYVYVDEKGHR